MDLGRSPLVTGKKPDGLVSNSSEPTAKIALFRSLFQGRVDVYAVRFESRVSGRAGYAPACANEWVRELCDKPRIKWAAYRRDRRKDALLQENGYLILRFLSEDVSKNLDHILNALLRAMIRRV